jgi:hypothetical protein
MRNQACQFETAADLPAARPTLRVFVAYEDARARSHAWQLYRLLAGDLASDMEIRPVFCHFAAIARPEHTAETTRAVIQADVVLFALSARGEMPAPMKAWIETWVEERAGHAGGLLIVIEHAARASKKPTANQIQFQELAQRAGMEFLAETVHPSASRSSHRLETGKRELKRRVSASRRSATVGAAGHTWAGRK